MSNYEVATIAKNQRAARSKAGKESVKAVGYFALAGFWFYKTAITSSAWVWLFLVLALYMLFAAQSAARSCWENYCAVREAEAILRVLANRGPTA